MNKALHVLVYLFLILAGVALWFEIDLNGKRTMLTDRNRLQEDFIVKIAKTIEVSEPAKDVTKEVKKDVSPVEAKLVDNVEFENLLDDYKAWLETSGLATFDWDSQAKRLDLRTVYVLNAEGKPEMDGNVFLTRGSPEDKMLNELLESAKNQRARLDTTRAELGVLRGKLDETVAELNKLKPEARQDKVTIVEKNEKIQGLETEKAALQDNVTKLKAQADELNAEITSLKDEVATEKDNHEATKEELAKKEKLVEQLKRLLVEAMQSRKDNKSQAVATLPQGDKGAVVEADNTNMFVIVRFSDEAMKELKGEKLDQPMPVNLEFGVKRPGFKGPADEFIGRIRLRQEIKDKNLVIADILGAWEQAKIEANDVIFAD